MEEGFTTIKLTMCKLSAHMIMTNMASRDHSCDDRGDDEQTTDGCEVPTGVPMMANYKKSRKNTLLEKRKMRNARIKSKRAARVFY